MTQTQGHYKQDVLDRIKKSFLSQEIIEAYSEGMGYPVTEKLIEDAEEAYAGTYQNEKEFSENILIEIGIADTMEDWLFYCLDFDSVWQEIRHDYFYVSKNEEKHFFRHL